MEFRQFWVNPFWGTKLLGISIGGALKGLRSPPTKRYLCRSTRVVYSMHLSPFECAEHFAPVSGAT